MLQVLKTILCAMDGYKLNTVDVMQGDSGSRAVACRLTVGGAAWVPPEGTGVRVAYTLPDGTPGLYDSMPGGRSAGTIDGSTVTVELLDRITAQPGVADVSVVLTDGAGAQLATFPFRVHVIGGNALTNPEMFPALGSRFEGLLFYGGPGGELTPLRLGPGLSIRDGVLYVSGGAGEPEVPAGVVTAEADENGALRVYLDGVEVAPVVDDAGDLSWPGLLLNIDSDGNATLQKEA